MKDAELIEKMAEALSAACDYFNARDEMNAAVHLPAEMRRSPITVVCNETLDAWRHWRFDFEAQRMTIPDTVPPVVESTSQTKWSELPAAWRDTAMNAVIDSGHPQTEMVVVAVVASALWDLGETATLDHLNADEKRLIGKALRSSIYQTPEGERLRSLVRLAERFPCTHTFERQAGFCDDCGLAREFAR